MYFLNFSINNLKAVTNSKQMKAHSMQYFQSCTEVLAFCW